MPTPALLADARAPSADPARPETTSSRLRAAAARWPPGTTRTGRRHPRRRGRRRRSASSQRQGCPTCRRTASCGEAIVNSGTIAERQHDGRPREPSPVISPSCPSWPIAVAGASVPVASAIATGNDSTTAIHADLSARSSAHGRECRRVHEPMQEHEHSAADEQQGHHGKHQPSAMAEPGQPCDRR